MPGADNRVADCYWGLAPDASAGKVSGDFAGIGRPSPSVTYEHIDNVSCC